MKCLVDISQYSSMKIGGQVSHFYEVKNNCDISDILNIFPDILIIGGGNNIVFDDDSSGIKVAKMATKGISVSHKRDKEWLVKFEAGENWDNVMNWCAKHNLTGIESLAGIPGTAGAAPVQNIGAYGTEICQTLESVEAYDRHDRKFVKIKNKNCAFSYRDSIFKRYSDRWVITAIFLKLSKGQTAKIPDYKEIRECFDYQTSPVVEIWKIIEAIKKVRRKKIPDPEIVPNCGSFFKNPIVSETEISELKKVLPNIPTYHYGSKIKIPAGYLIEKAGLKGSVLGRNKKIKIYEHNALILTNINAASFGDLSEAVEIVEKTVYEKFKIKLEPEVNIIAKNV